jgi:hypothetical protein
MAMVIAGFLMIRLTWRGLRTGKTLLWSLDSAAGSLCVRITDGLRLRRRAATMVWCARPRRLRPGPGSG